MASTQKKGNSRKKTPAPPPPPAYNAAARMAGGIVCALLALCVLVSYIKLDALHQEWIAECVSRGLFLASHHNHFMNAAVTQDDIKLAIDIAEDAFGVVAAKHPEIHGIVK